MILMKLKDRKCLFVVNFIILLSIPCTAQSITIEFEDSWGGIFAGRKTPYEITLSEKDAAYVSLSWKLVAKGRTLSSGQQEVRFRNTRVVTTSLPLSSPALKSGIKIEADLFIEAVVNEEQKKLFKRKIELYGPDVLLNKQYIFDEFNIYLFDPLGNTTKIFDELGITYTKRSKNQVQNIKEKGLLVIGEGVELDKQRGLITTTIELASRGWPVLILQPRSGTIPIPKLSFGSEVDISRLSFANNSIVKTFSEDYLWAKNDQVNLRYITLTQRHLATEVQISEEQGWSWFHLEFDGSDGRILVCMLPFSEHASTNPVPMLILSRLLVYANR